MVKKVLVLAGVAGGVVIAWWAVFLRPVSHGRASGHEAVSGAEYEPAWGLLSFCVLLGLLVIAMSFAWRWLTRRPRREDVARRADVDGRSH
jgi:hypothetical protein